MSTPVQDVAARIEGLGFANVQQFVLQPDPDLCIAVRPYGGQAPEDAFGSDAPVREYPRLQIVVRGAPNVPDEPYARAYQLCRALPFQTAQVLNGTLYYRLSAVQSPFWLEQDVNRRHVFAFNVEPYKVL